MFFSRIDTIIEKVKACSCECEQTCDICFEKIGVRPLIDSLIGSKNDALCNMCCEQLRSKKFYREDLSVKTCVLYTYHGFIRNLILRYKVYDDYHLKRYLFEYHRLWIRFHYSRYEYVIAPSNTTNSSKLNHLEILVENLGLKHSGINLVNNAPIKQAHCNSKERRRIRNYITLEKTPLKKRTKILIIDDIVTTGNTLEAIADQIKPFANHIEALCLAGTLTKLK